MSTASQNPFAASLRAQRIRQIVVGSLAILAVVAGVFFYSSSRQSGIRILNSPADHVISLNGKAVKTIRRGADVYIPVYSGVYRLKIERPQYAPFTTDIIVVSGKESVVRPVFTLIPAGQESSREGIAYVRPSSDQKSIYYLGDNWERLYRMEVANQVHIPLTERALFGVEDVQWSSNPDLALLVMDDGVYLHELLKYDFETQALVQIATREVISPVWDPTNPERFAAAYFSEGGEKSLVVADKRFQQIDRKADLTSFTDPKLAWSPDGKYILIINRDEDATQNNVWMYSIIDATMSKVTTAGHVVDANFNTDSNSILYESLDEGGENILKVYTLSAQSEVTLPVHGELSRTAWRDATSIYIPSENNELQLVRVSTGEITRVPYSFPSNLAVENMVYYPKSGALIFTTENAVYTVTLER